MDVLRKHEICDKERAWMNVVWYDSPLGRICLAADEVGLTGLWFQGAKYFGQILDDQQTEGETAVLTETKRWLDAYFAGRIPQFTPNLHLIGSDFRQSVWRLLWNIPYGQTTTYGALARQLAQQQGKAHLAAQAVGGAVGHNPISLIVPCHRVLGADGSLTGYAGGVERKAALLRLEQETMKKL